MPQKNKKERKLKIQEVGTKELASEIIALLKIRGKVRLAGIGMFTLKVMKARIGYNPVTLKYQKFPEYFKLSFSPFVEQKENMKKWNMKKIVKSLSTK